jgi:hypothetical protein
MHQAEDIGVAEVKKAQTTAVLHSLMHPLAPKIRMLLGVDVGCVETEHFTDDAIILEMTGCQPLAVAPEDIHNVALLWVAHPFAHSTRENPRMVT